MQKIYFLLAITYCCVFTTASAQFYKSFTKLSTVERETAAIELDNGFVFGYTETIASQNFHDYIVLVKTNKTGTVLWCRKYEAPAGISIKLMEMMRTADNHIIITGITGLDNDFVSATRSVMKLTANGSIVWAKKYTSGNPYDCMGLAQLKDSSIVFSAMITNMYPGIIQVNGDGNIIVAAKVSNRTFISVHSITAAGSTADVVVGNDHIANINFTTGKITSQRKYRTSNQFTALLSNRCKNGDIIYLAGRNSGGVLNGDSRIFRTKPNGSLSWAKNIRAFTSENNTPFSIFDIVSQVSVHEDVNGNIVAIVQAESTHFLVVVFSSTGQYLYNRFLDVPLSATKETKNGSYLLSAPPQNVSLGDATFGNRFFNALTSCDSSIFVRVSNGTDSAAALDSLVFLKTNVGAADIILSVENKAIQTQVFCDPAMRVQTAGRLQTVMDVTVSPNPATDRLLIKAGKEFPFIIYSPTGGIRLKGVTNKQVDVSGLQRGIYLINIITEEGILQKPFIKE